MKAKLSITVDRPLVRFLDSLPGASRSAKVESALRQLHAAREERALRRQLATALGAKDDPEESDAWLRTMERDQWSASDAERSGRSNSSRTRSRGRR